MKSSILHRTATYIIYMCMASHVAPGNIVCVAHFRVQFSVSCVVPPPPAVRGWLLTRLQKQYDKERERTIGAK